MIPTSIFACCRSLCHAAFGGGMGRFVVVRGAQTYRRRLQRAGRTGEEARKDRDMRRIEI